MVKLSSTLCKCIFLHESCPHSSVELIKHAVFVSFWLLVWLGMKCKLLLCWRCVKRWWILRAMISAVDLVCRLRTLRAPWLRALEPIFRVEQIMRWANLEFCALGRCALWQPQQLLSFPSVSGYCVCTRANCFLSLRVYRTAVQRDLQETRSQDKWSLYHLLMTLPLNLPHWLSKEWQLQGSA